MSLKIIFMGTPDFAVPALRALHEVGHEILAVYSQPPRPKGRGHQVQLSPVQETAEELGLPVRHPKTLKTSEAQDEFAAFGADVAVVAAYGLILPEAVLNAPRFGCLNIHASLLPRWRGASPIQHAIWKGDEESGVTIMQMEKGLDTGPTIAKRSISLTLETTSSILHDALCEMGGEMVVEVLDELEREGCVASEKQDDALSTYAPLLSKADGQVDWMQNAQEIDAQIRALNPWPGVWTQHEDARFKITGAQISEQISDQAPGTLIDDAGHVVCGAGRVLKLLKIQPAGAKPMDIKSAINGHYLAPGDVFA